MQPRVSIVIPYYNYGEFIEEALDSIRAYPDSAVYEIIIVNDGSTDAQSVAKLKELEAKGGCTIIHQENQGVCVARNTAIAHARGEYILPVDADNKIRPAFITKAMQVLDTQPNVAIVYCDYQTFGSEQQVKQSGQFNLQRLMLDNFIENCSMYRRSMFDHIGGYAVALSRIGIEDWEFWLKAAFHGYQFHYLNEVLFDYRVQANSRTTRLIKDKAKGDFFLDYISTQYPYFAGPAYADAYFLNKFKGSFVGFLGKIIIRLYFPTWYEKLVKRGKLRKYL
ncbi:MAG: glycosyltransferase family 2 protein [Chitinophagia bacterium]|nr:glycosyltransferase family 2 protein [Chitinophagia bacterium]